MRRRTTSHLTRIKNRVRKGEIRMSTEVKRQVGTQRLLARILEQPRLVAAVQSLEPRALLGLIDRIGLEDSGEIIALATVDQLKRVFDEDLWHSPTIGEDERLDPKRFLLWLEVMLEAGDGFAADKLAELPEDLVTAALHQHVLVIDLDELALEMSERPEDDDVAMLEKVLEGGLYHELGQYRVIARVHDGWDALTSVLVALDERHADASQRMLGRLCHASSEYIADNGGLYEVLTSAQMLESDAAAEREDRRARSGYVSPSSATSFLTLARTTDASADTPRDPVTKAYFREYDAPTVEMERAASATSERAAEVLRSVADLEPERPPRMLEGAQPSGQTLLVRALAELDAATHEERMRELAYLANVVVAGVSQKGRRLRAFDATELALATCNLGLEHLMGRKRAVEIAERTGCDTLFRVGWRLLFVEVSKPAQAVAHLLPRLGEQQRTWLSALLDRAPSLPGEWIGTREQIEQARRFLVSLGSGGR